MTVELHLQHKANTWPTSQFAQLVALSFLSSLSYPKENGIDLQEDGCPERVSGGEELREVNKEAKDSGKIFQRGGSSEEG
jgi:hypothetical protein